MGVESDISGLGNQQSLTCVVTAEEQICSCGHPEASVSFWHLTHEFLDRFGYLTTHSSAFNHQGASNVSQKQVDTLCAEQQGGGKGKQWLHTLVHLLVPAEHRQALLLSVQRPKPCLGTIIIYNVPSHPWDGRWGTGQWLRSVVPWGISDVRAARARRAPSTGGVYWTASGNSEKQAAWIPVWSTVWSWRLISFKPMLTSQTQHTPTLLYLCFIYTNRIFLFFSSQKSARKHLIPTGIFHIKKDLSV